MNDLKNKRVAVTGATGFLGKALVRELKSQGAKVVILSGPIEHLQSFREGEDISSFDGAIRTQKIDHSIDYLFHLAAPSSQTLFKRKPAYCIEVTLKGLINAAETCRKNGIRLIYPSTGLLSQDKYNEYAMCKKIGEDYIKGLNIDATGVRIFATYGPGEEHKADYASVPYLFARAMVRGDRPVVWGTGTQKRDFIYIDDVVEALISIALNPPSNRIVDVGSGHGTSFNEIIEEINKNLEVPVKVIRVEQPHNYVSKTKADSYWKTKRSLEFGINALVESLEGWNKKGKGGATA